MSKDDSSSYDERLEALRSEHRDLDQTITNLIKSGDFDDLNLQRLKKRKLHLKDLITQLESKIAVSA